MFIVLIFGKKKSVLLGLWFRTKNMRNTDVSTRGYLPPGATGRV